MILIIRLLYTIMIYSVIGFNLYGIYNCIYNDYCVGPQIIISEVHNECFDIF